MIEMGVDAAIGNQPDEVEAFTGGGGEGVLQGFVPGEGTIADGQVNAGEFLVHDATGPEVEVPHFGVSHLSFGEADLQTAGLESAPRIILVKAVVNRGFGKQGGVSLLFGARATGRVDSPTIPNQQENGF